jgi:hypothetical protein
MQLARQPHREVADVDHLLDLAEPFRDDLADLQGHEAAERLLLGAQLLAEEAHQLAAPRRRHEPPAQEGRMGPGNDLGHGRRRRLDDAADRLARDGRPDRERAGLEAVAGDAEPLEDALGFGRDRGVGMGH